jgi:hypothetical protein
MESILLKAIKDVNGDYTGIGELTPDEIAVLTGNLKFADGTEQTTAYVPGEGGAVASVFGRTGAIVAVANDYNAAKIGFDPTNVEGVAATNVQGAIEELGSIVKETASDMLFMGLLGFDDADPVAPAQPGPTHYYIFNTAGTRTVGDATGKAIAVGDWLVYHRVSSKWVHLDYSARQATAAGTTYDPGVAARANTYLTATNVQDALDQADVELIALNAKVDGVIAAPGGVASFNTRTGAVVPTAGDYNATQTTFAPTATVKATNVQAAIAEVDAKVVAVALPFFDTNGVSKPIPMA